MSDQQNKIPKFGASLSTVYGKRKYDPSEYLFKNEEYILDTETYDLKRGSVIHELSVLNLSSQELHEYILKPTGVQIENTLVDQDAVMLRSRVADIYTRKDFTSHREAIIATINRDAKIKLANDATDEQIKEAFKKTLGFLYQGVYPETGLPTYPHLLSEEEQKNLAPALKAQQESREQWFRERGLHYRRTTDIDIKDVIVDPDLLFPSRSDYTEAPKGKMVWIANAVFESKQIGAQLGALSPTFSTPPDKFDVSSPGTLDSDVALEFKSRFQTFSDSSPEPFYVTGKKLTATRVLKGQIEGRWDLVWEAYLKNEIKPGQIAVGDIQDTTRALISYLQSMGLMPKGDGYFGASIDIQARLLGSLENDPQEAMSRLLGKELHRASEDTVFEQYVLDKTRSLLFDIMEVKEGSEYGNVLRMLNASGKGTLHKLGLYAERLKKIAPALIEVNAIKRIERAMIDFETQGSTFITSKYGEIFKREAYEGGLDIPTPIKTTQLIQDLVPIQSMDELVDALRNDSDYKNFGIDFRKIANEYQAYVDQEVSKGVEREIAIVEYAAKHSKERVATYIEKNANEIMGVVSKVSSKADFTRMGPDAHIEAAKVTKSTNLPNKPLSPFNRLKSNAKSLGYALGGVAGLGLLFSGTSRQEEPLADSILTKNYQEWLEENRIEGFSEQGVAKGSRPIYTDFGSPYKGPEVSFNILMDQELLRERDRWQQKQFRAVHYDPEFSMLSKVLPEVSRKRTKKLTLGESPGEQELTGIQNKQGMKVFDVDPSDWKISFEDVDTLTITRRGLINNMKGFFGFNQESYVFRLEGIDSPEVFHKGGYHSPQPGADLATEGMKSLALGKRLKIAYDPSDETYGRNVGILYADGKNINLEAVKRGYAAFLPYGNPSDSRINCRGLEEAEEKAYEGNRGIWANPWEKVYREISKSSGNRITFNTFSKKEKIVQNYTTMASLSLMEQAQAMGGVNAEIMSMAQAIGRKSSFYEDSSGRFMGNMSPQAHYSGYMQNLIYDTTRFMATHGTNDNPYRYADGSGVRALNAAMALDTMGTTTSHFSAKSYNVQERYQAKKIYHRERKAHMAAAQREINNKFGQSYVNHARMA